MQQEIAQVIATQAFAWLLAQDELRDVFMGSTGVGVDDLRAGAHDSMFLASVLEFITMDDTWVRQFCDSHDLQYDDPLRARYALPGAEQVHWT